MESRTVPISEPGTARAGAALWRRRVLMSLRRPRLLLRAAVSCYTLAFALAGAGVAREVYAQLTLPERVTAVETRVDTLKSVRDGEIAALQARVDSADQKFAALLTAFEADKADRAATQRWVQLLFIPGILVAAGAWLQAFYTKKQVGEAPRRNFQGR